MNYECWQINHQHKIILLPSSIDNKMCSQNKELRKRDYDVFLLMDRINHVVQSSQLGIDLKGE